MVKFWPGTIVLGAWRPTIIAEEVERRERVERRTMVGDGERILILGGG